MKDRTLCSTSLTCPVCKSSDTYYSFFAIDVHSKVWTYYRCNHCKSLFLYPYQLNEHDAYDEQYYNLSAESKFTVGLIERIRDYFAFQKVRWLHRLLPPKARILDVGCGDGRLLYYFSKKRTDYELHGTELLPAVALRAKRRLGHRAWIHTVPSLKPFFPDEHFDVITCVHVFEHLSQPDSFLSEAYRLLKPGGLLFIEYPDISSVQAQFFARYWFHLDPPRHVQLIPSSFLQKMLVEKGFEIIHSSYFSIEQGVFGWIQSLFNLVSRRDILFEMLKNKFNASNNAGDFIKFMTYTVIAVFVLPLLVIVEFCFSKAKKGGIVTLVAKKISH